MKRYIRPIISAVVFAVVSAIVGAGFCGLIGVLRDHYALVDVLGNVTISAVVFAVVFAPVGAIHWHDHQVPPH